MSDNPYTSPEPLSTAADSRNAVNQRDRLLRAVAIASAIALLALSWPPFFVDGEFIMVVAPLPLWMRAEVALLGHAYIFEPNWAFFAALCAEIIAAGLLLDWRRRKPSRSGRGLT